MLLRTTNPKNFSSIRRILLKIYFLKAKNNWFWETKLSTYLNKLIKTVLQYLKIRDRPLSGCQQLPELFKILMGIITTPYQLILHTTLTYTRYQKPAHCFYFRDTVGYHSNSRTTYNGNMFLEEGQTEVFCLSCSVS